MFGGKYYLARKNKSGFISLSNLYGNPDIIESRFNELKDKVDWKKAVYGVLINGV